MATVPSVSVIIPTYNRKELVPRAVDSILAQTVQDFEIIIVDDGSTDGTETEIKRRYSDTRIRYDRLEKNSGVHAARNRGLDLAQGEYVVLLDSDDELLPHALREGVEVMQGDNTIGWCAAAFKTDNGILTGFDLSEDGYITYEDVLCERRYRSHKNCFAMLRRGLVKNIRYAAPNVDFIFFRQVAKSSRVYWIAQSFGIYHVSNDPSSLHISRRKPNIKRSIQRALALEQFVKVFEKDFCTHCHVNLGSYAYGAAVGLLLDGKKGKALRLSCKAFYSQPRLHHGLFLIFVILPFSSPVLRLLFQLKAYWLKTNNPS